MISTAASVKKSYTKHSNRPMLRRRTATEDKDRSQHRHPSKPKSTEHQPLITIQSEDINITISQFEKLKLAEMTCCSLAVAGFVCGAICSDITINPEVFERKVTQANIAYIFCTITTALLLLAIW